MQGIGQWIVFANKVIIYGNNGGVFVYNGTPALGNYPIFWATSAATDPYGNVLPGATAGFSGTNDGFVGYTGTPAHNSLSFSANNNNASITDIFGNVILPGITAYSGSIANGFSAVQLQALTANSSPLIAFYQAPNMTNWGSAVGIAGNPGSPAANFVISGQSGGVWMDSNGHLYIANPNSIGIVETWHAMPSFNTNFSHGSPVPAYKLNVDNTVSFAGEVGVTAGTTGGTIVTLPSSAYFPASLKKYPLQVSAGTPATTANVQLTITTAGNIELSAGPTGAAYTFALDDVRYPLDY